MHFDVWIAFINSTDYWLRLLADFISVPHSLLLAISESSCSLLPNRFLHFTGHASIEVPPAGLMCEISGVYSLCSLLLMSVTVGLQHILQDVITTIAVVRELL
jgi:hypothetical protein